MHYFVSHCLCNRYECMRKFYYAMSKGSLFMGTARGKLGEVVMYRANGEQISRVRVRKIANPRSVAQMIQRTFMATTSRAYSKMQAICDHSFEGKNGVMENMTRFTRVNIDKFKEAYNNSQSTWKGLAHFNGKNDANALVNNYIISEGSLPQMIYLFDNNEGAIQLAGNGNLPEAPTYQQVVDFLGCQQGDQITIVQALAGDPFDARMMDFKYARIILEPSDGDMSSPFLASGSVNKPNVKNQGSIWSSINVTDGFLTFFLNGDSVGVASILSRYENKAWRRSKQELLVTPNVPATPTLGEAVDSWEQAATSSLYLNQAES